MSLLWYDVRAAVAVGVAVAFDVLMLPWHRWRNRGRRGWSVWDL
ncbi:MAG TPA: hypothetical protein VHM30_14625 [Gemmatimonadaceae bacterium]|nr:hypothetical protein [Gemmatimonadaceae bacterium]